MNDVQELLDEIAKLTQQLATQAGLLTTALRQLTTSAEVLQHRLRDIYKVAKPTVH